MLHAAVMHEKQSCIRSSVLYCFAFPCNSSCSLFASILLMQLNVEIKLCVCARVRACVESIIKDTDIVRCEDLNLLGYGSLLIHKVTNIFKDSWSRKVSISYM